MTVTQFRVCTIIHHSMSLFLWSQILHNRVSIYICRHLHCSNLIRRRHGDLSSSDERGHLAFLNQIICCLLEKDKIGSHSQLSYTWSQPKDQRTQPTPATCQYRSKRTVTFPNMSSCSSSLPQSALIYRVAKATGQTIWPLQLENELAACHEMGIFFKGEMAVSLSVLDKKIIVLLK